MATDHQVDTRVAVNTSATTVPAVTAILALAAASWVIAVRQLSQGMDMGVATSLGSFAVFAVLWVPMTAAMMLPGAVRAVVSRARRDGGGRGVPLFVMSYLAVWALVGVAVYLLYRPHGTLTAGVVVIAAGVYEFTPLKHHFRRQCRENPDSGVTFGINCVGSSLGLMLMLLALGVMSITWMVVLTVLGVVQKLLPARSGIDLPPALMIIALGVLIIVAPAAVPGITPTMSM